VNDQVTEIDQHPPTRWIPFCPPGQRLRLLFGVFGNPFGQRLNLAIAVATAKKKVICENGFVSNVQQENVFSFLVENGIN
jgi:hypothetical protein